ncbi:MAG: hypothetical protein KC983_11545 [Phycisphaerales bacterium]|nr:hypothetical protein [Phycisphaerales bacterium]
MRNAVNVKSIEALREFRAALIEFRDVARTTISGANSDVQRAVGWLQHEQVAYWEREKRTWAERVARAKSELYRKQVMTSDGRPSDVDERRALDKAERRFKDIEEKIERTRHWARLLDRESMMFRGQLGALSTTVDAEFPRAEARLEKLAASLDAYLAMQMPTNDAGRASDGTSSNSPETGAGPAGSDGEEAS